MFRFRKFFHPVLRRLSAWYLSKPRKYRYRHLGVWVHPGVFPPFMTVSTGVLLDFISGIDLKNKKVLELGCGCGMLSVLAANQGAEVTATDINETALSALKENAVLNKVEIEVLYSDLFQNIKQRSFDIILVNPPYYPKAPSSIPEQAWFCGEQFEYFERLFFQLSEFITNENSVFIILSQDCQLEKIKEIALKNNLFFKIAEERKISGEWNFIFQITSGK